jgi:hypothetical protein
MPKTIRWRDGTDWTVDEPTFRRAMECLDAVREPVWGFEPILSRWRQLAEGGTPIAVDDFAPSEDDRAIVTAATERAVEHAKSAGAEALGFDEPHDYAAFVTQLERLHQLFVTDITHKLPRKGFP